MTDHERYTVFEEEFEDQTGDFGLSVEAAFKRIMQRCDYEYRFERRGPDYVLVAWQRTHPQLGTREVSVTMPDDEKAKRAIMLESFDVRFKAFRAMPDGAFEKHRREAFAFAASDIGFDEQQAIKDLQRRQHLRVVKD